MQKLTCTRERAPGRRLDQLEGHTRDRHHGITLKARAQSSVFYENHFMSGDPSSLAPRECTAWHSRMNARAALSATWARQLSRSSRIMDRGPMGHSSRIDCSDLASGLTGSLLLFA